MMFRKGALALAMLAPLAACSTPATPDQMTVQPVAGQSVAVTGAAYKSLSVQNVVGGNGTSNIGFSDVSDADFRTALESSLKSRNYLADPGTPGRYRVTAEIMSLDRPVSGFDPVLIFVPLDWSVTVKIHYRVVPVGGGQPLFDDLVAASGTADGASAATTDGRMRKAVEAAVRADIQSFIDQIGPVLK